MTTAEPTRYLLVAEPWVPVPYGTPRNRADLSRIDCSTLTAHVLDGVRLGLTREQWADIVLADGRRPWSPIERVVSEGWGVEIDRDGPWPVGAWCLVQGWRAAPPSGPGHALLAWVRPDGTLAVLEATPGYGVRWRGSPRQAPLPLTLDDAPTLRVRDLVDDYAFGLRVAALR